MSIKTLFQDIADAIKVKNTSIVSLTPSQMPNAIINLPTVGGLDLSAIDFIAFEVVKNRGNNNSYVQLSRLVFYDDNDNLLTYPTLSDYGTMGGFGSGYQLANVLFQENTQTALAQMTNFRKALFYGVLSQPVDLSTYKKWGFYTGFDSAAYASRDPISFSLILGNTSDNIYTVADNKNDYNTIGGNYILNIIGTLE